MSVTLQDSDQASHLRIANRFVHELLHGAVPFESSEEVLAYLVHESDSFNHRKEDRVRLRDLRLSLLTILEEEGKMHMYGQKQEAYNESVAALDKRLRGCGILHTEEQFGAIDIASYFSNVTELPCISSYAQQKQVLEECVAQQKDLELAYHSLTQKIALVKERRRHIPGEVLEKIADQTQQHTQAIHMIKVRTKDQTTDNAHAPDLTIGIVLSRDAVLQESLRVLREKEAQLTNFQSLPGDLTTIRLENDRMMRQLEYLSQKTPRSIQVNQTMTPMIDVLPKYGGSSSCA